MVIDCQACGAQQRVDDARVAASGGLVTCRSCGATIRAAARSSAIDDDEDEVTVVNTSRPASRPMPVGAPGVSSFAPIPIPLGGSESTPAPTSTQRNHALELGALGMSNSKTGSQFDVPTRPGKAGSSGFADDEPIPLLEADDIFDIDDDDASDAATMPGVPLSSITRASSSAPIPLPIPVVPTPQPVPKTPSFLEELPAVQSANQHDTPTRFNRNLYDHDEAPGIGDATIPAASAFPSAAFNTPSDSPEPLAMDFSNTDSYGSDLPAAFDSSAAPPPDLDDLPQWAPVEGAVVDNAQPAALDFNMPSDLPDLPAAIGNEPTAGGAASYHYSGTAYDQSGYESTPYDASTPPQDAGLDFDAPLPHGDGLPGELPGVGDTTAVSDQPPLELEGDLPTPSTFQGGVVLSDDLPMPSTGHGDIELDLPAPSSLDAESHQSVPQLMETVATESSFEQPAERREITAVVRDKKTNEAEEASTEEHIAAVKSKGGGLRYAVLAVVLIGGIVVLTMQFPEYVPFELPWAKPASIADNGVVPVPSPVPTPDATKPSTDVPQTVAGSGTENKPMPGAGVEAQPATPELTAANVNQLGYEQLREATKTLAADAKAASGAPRELLQWARFRLARYGDQEARDALLADAPQLSPQASELATAAAVGAQLLQKPMIGKKNAERLVGGPGPANKSRFKDSVAVLTVFAAANVKPPFKAAQIHDRILAIDPNAMDARVGKIEALLAMPKPELHAQAIASATSLVKAEPASAVLAVRLGSAAAASGDASAIMDLTAALVAVEQESKVPAGQAAEFARLLAHRAAIAGDFGTARRAGELAVKIAPGDVVAATTLARVISASGNDPESALHEARGAVRDVEGKAQLIDEQVKLALVRNDAAAAKKAMTLYGDLAPRPALPFIKLSEARLAFAEGKLDAARMAATAAAKMRPKSFEARLIVIATSKLPLPAELAQLTALAKQANSADVDARLAKAMVDRQNPGGAAELYARALWREPIAADAFAVVIALTDTLDRAGNADRAEAYLAALRANGSTDERLGTALMAHARRYGKGTAALEYFQAASAKNPTDIKAKLQYARALVDADRPADAQALLDALAHTEEGSKAPDVLSELARAWMTRDAVKARDYVNESIRLRPDSASYELLGEIEESQTKYDDAMDAYRKAIKLDSNNQEARVRLARTQIQRGQWQDAATQLRDIVQHDPSNIQATELLGDAMRDIGKPREALVWYKKALDITPDSATLMMKFARLQLQDLSAVAPAVKSFRHVLQVHPEVAEAHYYLGYALKDMGKLGEARTELGEYLKARPDGEFATEVKNDLQDLATP